MGAERIKAWAPVLASAALLVGSIGTVASGLLTAAPVPAEAAPVDARLQRERDAARDSEVWALRKRIGELESATVDNRKAFVRVADLVDSYHPRPAP